MLTTANPPGTHDGETPGRGSAPTAVGATRGAVGAGRADVVDAAASRSKGVAVLAFAAQAVSSATNFLRLVFVAHVCTAAQLGDYALGMTLIMWVMTVHERLVQTPYSVFAHRYPAPDRPRLLGAALLGSLASTLLPSLLLVAAGFCGWWNAGLHGMGPTLIVVGVVTPVVVLRETARSIAFSNFRMVAAFGIDAATLVVQAVLVAALWATDTVSVLAVYAAVAVSCLVPVAGWLVAWRGRWSVELSELVPDWRMMWSYARWLLTGRLMGAMSRLLPPWVLVLVAGKVEAGQLATCLSLVGVAWMFLRGISNYYVPYVLKSHEEGGAAAAVQSVGLMCVSFTVLLAPLCVLMAVAGDWLLTSVYGDKLAGHGLTAFLLSISALATAWAISASVGLLALDRPRDNAWVEGATLAGTALAALPMTHAWGVAGAAGAMLAGNLAGAALALVLFFAALKTPLAVRQGAAAAGDGGADG